MTDVAWSTLAQPTAAAVADDDDEAAAADAGFDAVTEPQPATAEDSSTASTVPRTWREDIMLLGRTPCSSRSIVSEASHKVPAAMTAPVAMSSAQAMSSLRSPATAPIRAPIASPARDMATLTTPNTVAARARLTW